MSQNKSFTIVVKNTHKSIIALNRKIKIEQKHVKIDNTLFIYGVTILQPYLWEMFAKNRNNVKFEHHEIFINILPRFPSVFRERA